MPFCGDLRSSGVIVASYLGPPGAAAQMCAATPMFVALFGSEFDPNVGLWQAGLLQRAPTRLDKSVFVCSEKSSRLRVKVSPHLF